MEIEPRGLSLGISNMQSAVYSLDPSSIFPGTFIFHKSSLIMPSTFVTTMPKALTGQGKNYLKLFLSLCMDQQKEGSTILKSHIRVLNFMSNDGVSLV